MSQTTKEKTNKRSVSVDERTSEESKSSSTATTHAVSKAWQSFEPQISLSWILADIKASQEKNS